jgi:hypothetical protein
MKIFNRTLWIHLILVVAMLSLLVTGCDTEATTEVENTIQPTPTSTTTTTETPTTDPTQTSTPTDDPTPTSTPTEEPTSTPSPTAQSTYPDVPPELPPSFLIDFDDFTSSNANSSEQNMQFSSFTTNDIPFSATTAAFGDQSYWTHAVFNVGFWSVVVVMGLAIPVAAFVASFHNIPYQQDDGSWIWTYDVRAAGVKRTAELHGTYIDDGVRWEIYLTKAGEYEDFMWYYGESDRPGTEGFWVLKESAAKDHDLLRIDWHRNIADGTGYIKYTNIVPGGPENGGYIQVETTTQTPYDSFWDIYNKGQNNHTYIEWNKTTEEGRVKDQKRFGDDNWQCWEGDHRNTVCP